jgi:DNA-binding MurR/RpiR family transcriptional regulator
MTDVAERIRERYSGLSRSERRIADLILGSPLLMIGFTLTEIAEGANVSKATVSRFVNRLGYEGWEEFRHTIRDGQEYITGSPLELMARQLDATHGDLQELVRQKVQTDRANLETTYADLSLSELDHAISLLSASRRVVFADFRKQYALAYYAATLFRVIRPNVDTLPILGASAVDGILDLGEDDLVVMFPFRRPERDHDILSKAVQEAGAKLITIGDVWPNPANERAILHFRCRTENAGVFDAFATPISLIELLFTATANRLGVPALKRLEVLEQKHVLFETFLSGYEATVAKRAPGPNGDGPA